MSFRRAGGRAGTARNPALENREEIERTAPDHLRATAAASADHTQISGTGSAYDIATLANGGAWSVAFSPDESRIYVARTDGKLDVFDSATLAKLATWDVGSSLGALSLSENGDFLLVVERFRMPGPFSPPGPPPSSTFYQVDTLTGAVTTFTRPGSAYIDVEIVDGVKAILTGGQLEVTTFNLLDHSYLTLPQAVYYSNNSIIVEDEHYTLFAETGISNGPLMIYDDRTGTIVASGDNYQTIGAPSGQTGFNFGHQAISEAGGLVAQFIYHSTLNLYDLDLNFLRGIQMSGPVDGLAFDITGKFLYVHSGNQLNLIDISNGAVVETFAVAEASWHNNFGPGDQIVLSEDGKTILVHDYTNGTLQVIDLHLRDEQFEGTAGADSFAGGKGDDTYHVNHSGDVITELRYDGSDLAIASVDYTIAAYVEDLQLSGTAARGTGNELDNRIEGTPGANLLQGLAGNDQLYGGDGDDSLTGGTGADQMDGGAGNDVYYVDNGSDVVVEAAGDGSDRVLTSVSYALSAGAEVETISTTLHTGTAAINLNGNGFANIVYGNDGINFLDGKGGADTLVGRLGNDFYYVDAAGDRVVEAVGEGNDRVFASVSYTLSAGAEVEVLSTALDAGTGAINLTGNALANTLYGNDGANILNGAGGADLMAGRQGHDYYYVDNAADRVAEGHLQGSDRVFASVSYALSAGAEVETLSTTSNAGTDAINLTGNEFMNIVYGNAGANILNGGGGADLMAGLAGNDYYYIDNGADEVVETADQGSDRLFASTSYVLHPGMSVETMSTTNNAGTGAIDLTGNQFANTIYGNAGANLLDGKGGNDVLVGFGGADSFVFTGGHGVDRIVDFSSADDTIRLDDSAFKTIGLGTLDSAAFVVGTAAADADDRIVYDQATGQLFYDADGNGAGAAILFATLQGAPVIGASDFIVF